MIYCRACGLTMSNGFCPHANIDEVVARAKWVQDFDQSPEHQARKRALDQGKR